MQFVPTLPPPIPGGPEEGGEIKKLREVKKVEDALAKPVSTPTIKRHAQHEPPANPGEVTEKRQMEGGLAERRVFCRRIGRQTVLAELRSAVDRRRKKQRKDDLPEHIDEKA